MEVNSHQSHVCKSKFLHNSLSIGGKVFSILYNAASKSVRQAILLRHSKSATPGNHASITIALATLLLIPNLLPKNYPIFSRSHLSPGEFTVL